MFEQMSVWDMLEHIPLVSQQESPVIKLRKVGEKIARVVLGECQIATITKVEGIPNHPFYRTDSGICYDVEDGNTTVEEQLQIALAEREKYKTICPHNLENRFTIIYPPRECDGKVLWAQIGIYNNMLFWKENVTYQFLESYKSETDLKKNYDLHKKNMLNDLFGSPVVEVSEHPMHRLYAFGDGYADAEYVAHNTRKY